MRIARTGQRHTADPRTMLAALRSVYAGQVEAKDQVIAAQESTMAELRRRAETAEEERDELRRQAAAAPPRGTSPIASHADRPDAPAPDGGRWAWLRRLLRGEED